jgi:two-component system response regulator ResD
LNRKVLIVEDDENIAELLQLYLEKEGFQTMIASTGKRGVELFEVFAPDLVLLDIMLPEMDGWGVCRAIREGGSQTPVIMLTAKGETRDKVSGLEMGAEPTSTPITYIVTSMQIYLIRNICMLTIFM